MNKNHKFAVIDIETTGGKAERDRITEIGIIITDGKQVFESFESLVNPETPIPYEITRLTGIDNRMVSTAPKFYEIAKRIVEITENTIFVAHNVRFDYGFIREEFARLGYAFTRDKLCTVVLSRKAFPGLKSYSLGNLILHFNLTAERRHRAYDDAHATSIILGYILEKTEITTTISKQLKDANKTSILPVGWTVEKVDSLPNLCGIYYMWDENGTVVYVGKSKHIKRRIWEHFTDIKYKSLQLQQVVSDISYTITGSELVANLLECHEIKRFKPRINKAIRNTEQNTAVFEEFTKDGYPCFVIKRKFDESQAGFLSTYRNQGIAKKVIENIIRKYELCPDIAFNNYKGHSCMAYSMGYCKGICADIEEMSTYMVRHEMAIKELQTSILETSLWVESGPDEEMASIIYIENGIYKGYCNWSVEDVLDPIEIINSIKNINYHPDYQKIIKLHLAKRPIKRILLESH